MIDLSIFKIIVNIKQCRRYLFIFTFFTAQPFKNRQQNVTLKGLIDMSIFRVRPCGIYWFSIALFSKNLIDSWCSFSQNVNHVSGHGYKCLLRSVVSNDKSECVAKFHFASVSKHFSATMVWLA